MEHTPAEHTTRHTLPPATARMLAVRRRARGWSLRAASSHTGISFGYLGALERGERAPSLVLAGELALAYRLTGTETLRLLSGAVEGVGRGHPRRVR